MAFKLLLPDVAFLWVGLFTPLPFRMSTLLLLVRLRLRLLPPFVGAASRRLGDAVAGARKQRSLSVSWVGVRRGGRDGGHGENQNVRGRGEKSHGMEGKEKEEETKRNQDKAPG